MSAGRPFKRAQVRSRRRQRNSSNSRGRRGRSADADEAEALAQRRVTDIMGAMAHSFRNSLTIMEPIALAIAGRPDLPDRARHIVQGVSHLHRTVEAMEQYSLPRYVRRRMHQDMPKLVRQAINKALSRVSELGYDHSPVRINVARHAPCPKAFVSRRLIVRALAELVRNALEAFATEDDADRLSRGRITIRLAVLANEFHVTIRDNGRGMQSVALADVLAFVPGTPNRAKRASAGWGVCLAHRFVTAHGGWMDIASKFGRGTTVTVALPLQTRNGGQA